MRNRRRNARGGLLGMAPAGRHRSSSPHTGLSSGRARRSLGRLVVTPTFAAGACILFAAVLAYGTTQTHLAFRGLGPACAQANCSATGQSRPHAAGAPGRTYANGYAHTHGPSRHGHGADRHGHRADRHGHGASRHGHGASRHGHGASRHGHRTDRHGHRTDRHGHRTDRHGHRTDRHGHRTDRREPARPRHGHGANRHGHRPAAARN